MSRWGPDLTEQRLYSAVWDMDIPTITHLLETGADVNKPFQVYAWFPDEVRRVLYTSDASPILDTRTFCPNTPLKLCVSRLSGVGVGDAERETLINIASLLIAYSADVSDGKDYFLELYGEAHPSGSQWDRMYMLLCSGDYK